MEAIDLGARTLIGLAAILVYGACGLPSASDHEPLDEHGSSSRRLALEDERRQPPALYVVIYNHNETRAADADADAEADAKAAAESEAEAGRDDPDDGEPKKRAKKTASDRERDDGAATSDSTQADEASSPEETWLP